MIEVDFTDLDISHTPDAERQLWAAVIYQAIEDATDGTTAITSPKERERAKDEARAWLLQPNKDFDQACHLAGLEPDCVRAGVHKLIVLKDQGITKQPKSKASKPKRQKQLYTHDGRSLTLMEWAKETGIKYNTLYTRINKGMCIDEALAIGCQKPGHGWRKNPLILQKRATIHH